MSATARNGALPAVVCRVKVPSRLQFLAIACLAAAVDTGAQTNTWRQCLTDTSPAAVEACTSIILLDPRNDGAFVNRGIAYRRIGDLDRAIKDYDEAIRLNPRAADAFNNRGNAFRTRDEFERALRRLRRRDSARSALRPRLQQSGHHLSRAWRTRSRDRRLRPGHRRRVDLCERVPQSRARANAPAAFRSRDRGFRQSLQIESVRGTWRRVCPCAVRSRSGAAARRGPGGPQRHRASDAFAS